MAHAMACPYFLPTRRHDRELWTFRARLPLGDGWSGECHAPGHEGVVPADDVLREHCNLGYAGCGRLPVERAADAVHFSVAADAGDFITLQYALERDYAPAGHGSLEYECPAGRWTAPHSDGRLQAMAQSYLDAYLARRPRSAAARSL